MTETPQPLAAHPASGPLTGEAAVPGDKSISHRALLLGALAEGTTRVSGILEGDDVMATARAVSALGVPAKRLAPGVWEVAGGGLGALCEPDKPIDCGNAGTLARLLTGILAANPMATTLTGDSSLSNRPMDRVFAPMRAVGADILCREGGRLPATIRGTRRPLPIDWTLSVASAQVKSAILLAALHGPGETTVLEPVATRDHTERMLQRMGAALESQTLPDGGRRHVLVGGSDLAPVRFSVPRDPSSAALIATAALVVEGSTIRLPSVCINRSRIGFFETIAEMGADISFENQTEEAGEPVADLCVRQAPLRGIRIPPDRAPFMIDEYPALAVLAAFAEGKTTMEGVGELRAKETDRIQAMADGLAACGVRVETGADRLVIRGSGHPAGGATIRAQGDHRIAMAFLALGQGALAPVRVDDARAIGTSFPGFAALLSSIGGRIEPGPGGSEA